MNTATRALAALSLALVLGQAAQAQNSPSLVAFEEARHRSKVVAADTDFLTDPLVPSDHVLEGRAVIYKATVCCVTTAARIKLVVDPDAEGELTALAAQDLREDASTLEVGRFYAVQWEGFYGESYQLQMTADTTIHITIVRMMGAIAVAGKGGGGGGGSSSLVAGEGISISGNTISVSLAPEEGASSIPGGAVDPDTGAGTGNRRPVKNVGGNTIASPYVVQDNDDIGYLITNVGATEMTGVQLPDPQYGRSYTFAVDDADGMRITAVGGAKIRYGGSQTTSNGFIQSTTQGDVIFLTAYEGVGGKHWFAESFNGFGAAGSDDLVITSHATGGTASSGSTIYTDDGINNSNESNWTLSGTVGSRRHFYCRYGDSDGANSDSLKVTAPSGETIRAGAAVTGTAGNFATSQTGAFVTFVKVTSTEWAAMGGIADWAGSTP